MGAPHDLSGVTISAREIYDQIVGLRDDVRSLTQSNTDVAKTLEDHEERIRGVERWKYSVPVGVIAGVGGALVTMAKASGLI
ncbi:hypothetical protein [Streptomyces chattanoogensis]|uniref:hypothetical protein n=1 Tax=Streptomyces chattanoogensis TaxID=66876 RepID=UPI0036BBBC4E